MTSTSLSAIHDDLRIALHGCTDTTIELGATDIMVVRQISDVVRRCVRITSSDEDPPVFVMSYGDNDLDCRVYGQREFILRVIKQFVVDLQPSSAIPRE